MSDQPDTTSTVPDARSETNRSAIDRSGVDRRTVLRSAGVGGAGVAAAAALAACGGTTTPPATGGAASSTTSAAATTGSSTSTGSATSSGSASSSAAAPSGTPVKTADVPVGGGIIQGNDADTAFVVTQPTAGVFKAFSRKCTHQGCKVTKVAQGMIDCPCHQSQFDITTGAPTSASQAKSPLPAKTATVSGDSVYIA